VQDWEIYCPDTDCVLALSSELVYDDCPWLTREKAAAAAGANSNGGAGRKGAVPKDVRYVHSKVIKSAGEFVRMYTRMYSGGSRCLVLLARQCVMHTCALFMTATVKFVVRR
jgi:hypothetical protein